MVGYPIKSTYTHSFSTVFNKCFDLVRDQGVGGSNPLSPTNKINQLESSLVVWSTIWYGPRCPSQKTHMNIGFL
jgi:hypothetical protein